MAEQTIVIVGAALAGGTAAFAARKAGFEGEIVLIGAEKHLPYGRPPLSKTYLRGEGGLEDWLVRKVESYAKQRIDTRLDTKVTSIDPARHRVVLEGGEEVAYGKLLVATGGRNRRPPIPGIDLEGVFQLRTIEDADRIREAAAAGRRVVVAGLGFIGSEVAASLRTLGLEVSAIDGERFPLARVLGDEVGAALARMHGAHGTELVLGDQVAAFEGSGRVERVRTKSGRLLECDFVVAGFGIEPEVALLKAAGADIDNGVLVDERTRTSLPDVHAAGDVANRFNPVFKERMRLEHWNNGDRQGRVAGSNLAGREEVYADIPSFWSDQYDTSFQYVGHHTAYDRLHVEGDLESPKFRIFYIKDHLVRAVFAMGVGDDVVPELELLVLKPPPQLAG